MRQLVCNKPGEFEYKSGKKPVLESGQAIIKVKKIGVCGTDLHAFEGTQPFFSYPRILGHELAGEIVAIEANSGFEMGEMVTFIPYFNCGKCIACRNEKPNCCTDIKVFGVHIDGGMSEYISVPTYSLVHGAGLSYDELALIEPLAIGVHGIRRAKINVNDKVLIVGAGPIGLGIIEFAKITGCEMMVMDVNESRLNFCKEKLGIKHLINPAKEDVANRIFEITNGDMATVVIDATGNLKAINQSFRYLAHGGQYILVGLQKGEIVLSHPEFHKREATLMSSRNAVRADFEYVIECIKNGLVNPQNYITHRVDFEQVKDHFSSWLDPANRVIKALISID